MKQSQSLRLGHQLAMTPALQQSIRLLQMSTLDLEQEIRSQLESNFMLEAVEAEGDSPAEAPEAAASTAEDVGDADSDWASDGDSRSVYSDDEEPEYARVSQPDSLHQHLLWQARMHAFDATGLLLAEHIIDAVDDNGYLQDWETLNLRLQRLPGVDTALPAQVLTQIQGFDPSGVAARSIGECLRLQLLALDMRTPGYHSALRLLQDEQIPLLASRNLARIAAALEGDHQAAGQALRLVQSLAPHPGAAFSRPELDYITPEVFVRRLRGQWQVQLNPKIAPRLRVNPEYAALLQRVSADPQQQTLRQHLQEARFFLHAIKGRNDTLLRVAECIVAKQRGFLDYGAEAMRPLILRDIAQPLGMHESTVSRATAGKYMATPRGTFELKHFFSSRVATTTGGEASATAIQAIIQRLISNESPERPHSDSKLTELLREEGVKVARRTIAKYREALHIAPSHLRKESST